MKTEKTTLQERASAITDEFHRMMRKRVVIQIGGDECEAVYVAALEALVRECAAMVYHAGSTFRDVADRAADVGGYLDMRLYEKAAAVEGAAEFLLQHFGIQDE